MHYLRNPVVVQLLDPVNIRKTNYGYRVFDLTSTDIDIINTALRSTLLDTNIHLIDSILYVRSINKWGIRDVARKPLRELPDDEVRCNLTLKLMGFSEHVVTKTKRATWCLYHIDLLFESGF